MSLRFIFILTYSLQPPLSINTLHVEPFERFKLNAVLALSLPFFNFNTFITTYDFHRYLARCRTLSCLDVTNLVSFGNVFTFDLLNIFVLTATFHRYLARCRMLSCLDISSLVSFRQCLCALFLS
ncbi:unnamed protein product [Diabrotica balteata]|uniref:Uncharacterized protein n=1 Tax=Diabrotica balteata TaxID=107213 RepID=A0A9N9SQ68_DIABA|nr:unnamed protein product [Diabrotica balteata]